MSMGNPDGDDILSQLERTYSLLQAGDISIELDGLTLDIVGVVCASRYGFRTTIASDSLQSLKLSRDALELRISQGEIIYGVNTGFGGSADLRPKELKELQHTLTRELTYGVLPPGTRDHKPNSPNDDQPLYGFDFQRENTLESQYIPWSWVRAAIVIRLNSLIKRCSAVRPIVVESLQNLLTFDIVPMTPLRGSISASGDLNPLAYISGVMQGKSTIRVLSKDREELYADTALRIAGLKPISLEPKEGLALVNGTAMSAGAGALATYDANHLAALAQVLTAMSVEALNGTAESFHPFLSENRPHPGQITSARNILAFLQGSRFACVNDGTSGSLRQDRYSIRTAPQWLGPSLEDLALAQQQIHIECNSATDNPLIDHQGRAIHGGNFQAKAVTSAMEKTRQAMQAIGRMLFAQCVELINPATSRGLPPNLVAEEPSTSGIFKAIDLHVAALQSELGFLSAPVNHVQTAEMGNQALNSLALISARYTHTSINVLTELAAAHLLSLCQALDLRRMTSQFLDSCRPHFFLAISQAIQTQPGTTNHSLLCSELGEILWQQMKTAFSSSTHMDDGERFKYIAETFRSPFMTYKNLHCFSNPLATFNQFSVISEELLFDHWRQQREFYLLHGEATESLGAGTRQMYTFVRKTLGIPFLSTRKIATPHLEDGENRLAPSLGSYTGVLYRALRDGTLLPCLKQIFSGAGAENT